jgi:Acetylornithine deacetylase/Succinyl-diaminopimelate desuccinylase and related deacylases
LKEKAFAYIDQHREEMLALWKDLVDTESGSYYSEGVDEVANKIDVVLKEEGINSTIIENEKAGNAIIAEFVGEKKAPVMFLGHMDTVFKYGEVAKRPFTIKADKAYGPGVLDMKGGIVIALFVVKALKAAGFSERPIKVVFAGDEEIAHVNSNAAELIMEQAKGCIAAFNFETGFTDNSFVTGRKGTAIFKLRVQGVTAHAGNDPKRGRSAILEMAHKVIDIQNLTNWDKGYTFNVGTINGGTIFNAVPGVCEIDVDIRYLDPNVVPEIKEKIDEIVEKTYIEGTRTELVDFHVGISAMQTTDGVKKLFKLLAETSEENGFGKATDKLVGGGSDSAYTVIAGVPTVCSVGVKGANNHAPEEYAVVESMFERAKLIIATVLKLKEFK